MYVYMLIFSSDLERAVREHLFHFGMYDFLWKDDMCGNYREFIEHDPGTYAIKREVERLLRIEKKVLSIPQVNIYRIRPNYRPCPHNHPPLTFLKLYFHLLSPT